MTKLRLQRVTGSDGFVNGMVVPVNTCFIVFLYVRYF